jgi:putative oxidoreductase
MEWIAGRYLLAMLFAAGAVQKALDPEPAQTLLAGYGLPEWLVWPALLFNAAAACLLITGSFLKPVGRALAFYCIVTSVFHFVPSDPWQISIMFKNWAIAGGCLILAASFDEKTRPLGNT